MLRAAQSAASLCLLMGLVALAPAQSRPAHDAKHSLSHVAPASVGLFVELREPADLLVPLTEPELWSTLAELAGQPARSVDTRDWTARIRRTVDLDPVEAIRTLFSRRVAFLGAGPRRSQDAVVLCEPADGAAAALIDRRKPNRIEDIAGPPTYHLYAGLGVAVQDRLLAFGDLVPEKGLFRAYLADMAEERSTPRLADDPAFRALAERLPREPDGLLFARLRAPRAPGAATQPAMNPLASLLPASLRGADNLMIAMQRDGRTLRFTAVGEPRRPLPASRPADADPDQTLLNRLPASVLGAWRGHVDFPALLAQVDRLPPSDPLRSIFNFSKSNDVPRRLADSLGTQVCVAIGTAAPPGRPADAPEIPTAAVLIELRDAAVSEEAFKAIADSCINLLNLLVLARGQPPIPDAADRRTNDHPYHFVDLSRFVERIDHNAVAELHGAWAVSRNVLIVASHESFLLKILNTDQTDAGLAQRLSFPSEPRILAADIVTVDTAAFSDLATRWLAFFRRTAPQAMDERWWRTRQPGGSAVRLGIDVELQSSSSAAGMTPEQSRAAATQPHVGDAAAPRLLVRGVNPNMPAAGRLQTGDVLLGTDGKRFASTQPWVEMRERLESRANPNYVDIQLERGGRVRVERLPIPYFDPIQALCRIESLGRLVTRFAYFDEPGAPGGSRGLLTVTLAPPPSASAPSPTSAPASRPSPR